MIRIKRFDESFRYPKQVRSEEFFKKRSTHKMVDFSSLERKQIRDILDAKRYHWSFSGEYFEVFKRPSIEVVKLSDDWSPSLKAIVDHFISVMNLKK